MAPNAAGRIGEQSPRDLVLCRGSALMILSAYLAVADILDVPASQPAPGDEAELAECRAQVVEALSWVQPRWRGAVAEVMFAQARRWLDTAGTWDRVVGESWIAGAHAYLRVLAPPVHRAQAELLAGHDALGLHDGARVAVLDSASAARLNWVNAALEHPAAMIHAAAALTASLWALPGIVNDPEAEQVGIARRGVEDLKAAFAQRGV
jgi:hypothetical protein